MDNATHCRHELKYRISPYDYYAMRQVIRHIGCPDSHADDQGRYHVRSLYFDNFENKALREKLDGVSRREKFRLRFYNRDTGFIKAEKKARLDGVTRKDFSPITAEECERLLQGDIAWMAEAPAPLLRELHAGMRYQLLRPAVIVEYTREAYQLNAAGTRITFDTEIRGGNCTGDFLKPEATTLRLTGEIILEIKYNAFLPGILGDLLRRGNRQPSAFSKYAAARLYGVHSAMEA